MNHIQLSMEPSLSQTQARQVQRHHDRLRQALAAQDRADLRRAKQELLRAAYAPPAAGGMPPEMRRALRRLAWHMAGMRLPRSRLS